MKRLSYPSGSPNQLPVSEMPLNITLHSPCSSKPSHLSSLKDGKSTLSTKPPLDDSSMLSNQHTMDESLTMIGQYETRSQFSGTFVSLIPPLLMTSKRLSYPHSALVPIPPNPEANQQASLSLEELVSGVTPVINGIGVSATSLKQNVSMPIVVTAEDAEGHIRDQSVPNKIRQRNEFIA
ncbi:hypothetical protein ID866_10811 [Astraeus odoratus]|nr:hypothetical protein ID866_10811 [Astraeus odoratus]